MYHRVKVGKRTISPIDWDMTPDLSFGTYESWGGRERVRDNSEQVYYFFVDNWGEKPRVCLMERAVKHARILAEIDVPAALVEQCVKNQGATARYERSLAVDEQVKGWLIDHVLEGGQASRYVHEVVENDLAECMGAPLPAPGSTRWSFDSVLLSPQPVILAEDEVVDLIRRRNFHDALHNPGGHFANGLVDGGHGTVVDERTGLQWQAEGIDIGSLRSITAAMERIRRHGFAGRNDWRLPSLEEAMSLVERQANFKGLHINPCFSGRQPFIVTSTGRPPGGHWFVDYKQGRCYWASATNPGGFGRLCRSL